MAGRQRRRWRIAAMVVLVLAILLLVADRLLVWTMITGFPRSGPNGPVAGFPKVDNRPAPSRFSRGRVASLPRYDAKSDQPWQIDLRGADLSALDLADRLEDLKEADFDSNTRWPSADRLPADFDPSHILELGKDPGLGLRALHALGITGRGVGVGIIDQPLLVDHQEYADRLRLYEEIHVSRRMGAQMHGAAVASLAVGKTTGVAPEADLYYIASWTTDPYVGGLAHRPNFRYYAQAVRRLLEVNTQLPRERRIRAISMQIGWSGGLKGCDDIMRACDEAKAAGILVVSSSLEEVHGFRFQGLGREPAADPDDPASYGPGGWWAKWFHGGEAFTGRLLVPMDSRTTASCTGSSNYLFCRRGGWSWSIPYIAGLYALAAQVDPQVTPERFWSLALATGRTVEVRQGDSVLKLGPIADPAALVARLRSEAQAVGATPAPRTLP